MANDYKKYDADFFFIRDHLIEFFNRRPIQRVLNVIEVVGITGWEKWWQIEFATWLSGGSRVGDWVMEEVFRTDLRLKPQKSSIIIDIGFRLKGFSTKEMLFLELKQNGDWHRCIGNMFSDVEKVDLAQTYSVNNKIMIRNFFVVGIYPRGDATKKDIHDYIEGRAEKRKIPVERKHIFTKFIRNTSFSFTVF